MLFKSNYASTFSLQLSKWNEKQQQTNVPKKLLKSFGGYLWGLVHIRFSCSKIICAFHVIWVIGVFFFCQSHHKTQQLASLAVCRKNVLLHLYKCFTSTHYVCAFYSISVQLLILSTYSNIFTFHEQLQHVVANGQVAF